MAISDLGIRLVMKKTYFHYRTLNMPFLKQMGNFLLIIRLPFFIPVSQVIWYLLIFIKATVL